MYDFIFMIIIITFVDIVNCVERGILTHSATKQKADNDIISRKNPPSKKKHHELKSNLNVDFWYRTHLYEPLQTSAAHSHKNQHFI